MLRPVAAALAGLGLGLASLSANAVAIFFDPAFDTVTLGDSVSVDVVIEDLDPPALATFDLDVLFDDSILDVTGVAFGDGLNGGDPFDSLQDDSSFAGGHNANELSFLPDGDLNADQPGSFTLFTLTFETLAVGTSALTTVVLDLGAAGGGLITADLRSGSITVEDAAADLPEPAPLALLAFGLLALGVRRARRKR